MGRARLPIGKTEKALLALAAVGLGGWLLESTFPVAGPLGRFALALLLILGGLLAMRRIMGLARWLVRRMLWRVRHRMIAVFFFVGVLPISIGALLALWGAILILGPVTAYMNSQGFRGYIDRMQAAAEPLLWQLAESPPQGRPAVARTFREHAARVFPEAVVVTEFDGAIETYPEFDLPGAIPSNLSEATTVDIEGKTFFAAEAEDDRTHGRVIVLLPATQALLNELMPGLGILALQRGVDPVDLAALPAPRHPLDWQITWGVRASALDWKTDSLQHPTYLLRTRPSAMWGLIFGGEPRLMQGVFAVFGYLLLAAFCANILISLFIALSLTRTLTRSVNDLYTGTKHVNRGDFSYRIPVRGGDQVSDLSRSFNAMTASIERLIEGSKRHQQLQAELEIAREVQAQLFPSRAPVLAGIEILGVCRPARSVSGDFYDYVGLDSDRMAICFGDVSGKGISAALVMASLHSIMRTQIALLQFDGSDTLQRAAARVVERANVQLCDGTAPEKFSTLFFGAYDEPSGLLAYCNAGHLPPLLFRNGRIQALEVSGMIVGAFPFAAYTATTLELRRGDMLVAFTDGLTEAENDAGEEYGEERLGNALHESAAKPMNELIEGAMNDVVAWTGGAAQQDDMTMLVVRKR